MLVDNFSTMKKLVKFLIFFVYFITIQSIFCSFPFIQSDVPQNDPVTHKIRQLHQLAQNYIDLGENDKAETYLDSIINLRPDYEAYLKLGRLNGFKKKWYLAENFLKQAHKLKRKYSPIYYELGMLYKNGPFQVNDAIQMFDLAIFYDKTMKDAYYQKALLFLEYNGYRRGHGKLEKLILIDPGYRNSYDLYLRVGFAFHRFGKMCGLLEKLTKVYPENPKFQLDYAEVLYRNRKYKEALSVLKEFKKSFSDTLACLYYFHKSRIYIALKQDTLGTDLYWKAVKEISTGQEANKLFNDVVFLVTDQEYNSFKDGTLQQKKDFFYKFWKRRDPTLTTPFNERIPEHYKRLVYVRRYNKRLPVKQFLSFFLKDLAKPVERKARVTLDLFSSTIGSKSQQEIDDMGIIYVRHGPPDEKSPYDNEYTIDSGGNNNSKPFTPVWRYYAKYGRPELYFKFFMPSSRTPGRYREEGWCLVPNYIPDIKYATATATTNYEPEFGRFDIPFCQYNFKGEEKQQNVFIYFDLPDRALPDSTNPNKYALLKEFTLFDSNWKEVYRVEKTEDFKTGQVPKVTKHNNYERSLKPGIYHAGLRLANKQSGEEGILRLQLKVPPIQSGLKIQGIILGEFALNREILSAPKLNTSAASKLIPNIRRIFSQNEIISVYFEIYNLSKNSKSQTDFSITIKIVQVEKNQSGISKLFSNIKSIFKKETPAQMTIEDDYSGTKPDEYIFRTIQLPNYSLGIYKMMISVMDQNSNRGDSREVSFEIVK